MLVDLSSTTIPTAQATFHLVGDLLMINVKADCGRPVDVSFVWFISCKGSRFIYSSSSSSSGGVIDTTFR
jgi:hypothetical protein